MVSHETQGTQRKIVVLLDSRVPMEALILHRLQSLPMSGRKGWISTLLVRGFESECRTLKEIQMHNMTEGAQRGMNPLFSNWLAHHSPPQSLDTGEPISHEVEDSFVNNKPFSYLSKVIG